MLICLSRHKILTFRLGASFVFSKKINSEDTTMPLRGKYACVEGLLRLFY
jgi:hypothetical protein